MGPVVPLLAVVPELLKLRAEVVFVGTPDGPERAPVEELGLPFYTLRAPRLRRFLSAQNFLIPFQLMSARQAANQLLQQLHPQVIVSAGGFVSVPLVRVAKREHIPVVIHQQDIRPGLANRLMQKQANTISVAFESSLNDFSSHKKVVWIGNPVRDLTPTTKAIPTDPQYPTILIFGGGTGAQSLNHLVSPSLCQTANVIHLTGKGKTGPDIQHPRYLKYEFLGEEMKEALHKAEVVVCRAGLGTISELAELKKVALVIPLPNSHQEDNAAWLEAHDAAIVFDQAKLDPDRLTRQVNRLLTDQALRSKLSKHIAHITRPGATQRFAQIIVDAASLAKTPKT